MNKGFSIIEILVSLILMSVLSTSLFLFLDGYREVRFFEKKRLDAFREASALMEAKMDFHPSCVDETKHRVLDSWGVIELNKIRITEKVPLVFIRIRVFSKENKRLLSLLEKVVQCH